MITLYDLDLPALTDLLKGWEQPVYRAKQLWAWLYQNKVETFEAMTNLPKALRERLAAETVIGTLTLVSDQLSIDGQTVKRLFRLPDGQLIESVLMEYDDGRRTACISTQAGCAMGCVFCATGQMGFARHLTDGEIVQQALHFARLLEGQGDRLSNIVLMGMGEPLHNYENTLKAIHKLHDPDGLNIGARHITLSTVGLVPAMRRFADEGLQVGLAISLHAATDEERNALLPVNRRHPIADVISAARYYVSKIGRRVTFEWALIRGENDTIEQAARLGTLLKGLLCHVNMIPLNPTGGYDGAPSDLDRVDAFQAELTRHGITSTVRVRRGIDIQAGCGQLKTQVMERERRKQG
ncbi:MAG TPA: 23S rRNA (adenine(2503)-C(2))-methyltransferase RlmN [Aggregatilineales bacterium]|nr:23S rRNA (adenine(2503)-C(2))-methyltransferase RlmN [Anaerolineales bacterium]HRE48318.1 23S rRNA (adenine(2503)-C(2))-methyltransferase RlmN [Aggregatilineales bacterium]